MNRRRVSGTVGVALTLATARAAADEGPAPAAARSKTDEPCAAEAAGRGDEQTADPDSVGSVTGRVIAEVLMGSGVGTVGFLLGPQLGGAGCRACYYAAAFAGASVGFPLGVAWGGHLGGGDGSLWLTAAGPWTVTVATVTALALDSNGDGEPALRIATIGGAIAAPLGIVLYEIASAASRTSTPTDGALSVPRVAVNPRRGGLTVGVSGSL